MKKISERIANTANISVERLSIEPPPPKSIKIEVTSHCDLKCYFCQLSIQDRKKGDIDKSLLLKILKQAKAAGVDEVGLFWIGEPFLNKSLSDYVMLAKEIGFNNVFITTNGRLANLGQLKSIFAAGIDSIKFSINASTKASFKEVTSVDAYDKILNNIKLAHTLRGEKKSPKIYASSVYDPDNLDDYKAISKQVAPFVDEHYPIRLYGENQIDGATSKLTIHRSNRTLQSMLPCWSLFTIPHISYDGFMSACYCDFNEKFYMADLKEVSFMDAWLSPQFKKLRAAHLNRDVSNTPCIDCTAYK